jgi:ABC-type uncharacterized transport system ATPase subunit
LEEIRSKYKSHAVSVELDGDTGFIRTLPMIAGTRYEGRRLEIDLAKDADPQELLKALVGRVKVSAFEVKAPSLHEIFVKVVGASDAENS